MTTKKLTKLLALYLPYILLGLVATNFGEAWRLAEGKELGDKIMAMMGTIPLAFANPLPSLHPLDLLIGFSCGAGLRLAVYLRSKNAKKYRHGMEYGSARWGTAKDIEPFQAPKFADNIILTKTERLMMSNRPPDPKNARNKNVLVVGGSGSGKTRFWLKPNLLQCHSSYVVTDSKGTIVLECGQAMLKNGYKVKILNTINFKKSMHYNPFSYVHSEKDILKLVTTLMTNTKGEGSGGDPFWEKSERLLLTALIAYKQRFISQIMTSKSPVRSCEDVDEQALSYAEIKALCAGNPLIKEKMDLDVQVAKLKVLKADHQSQKFRLQDKLLTKFPAGIQETNAYIAGVKADAQLAAAHPQVQEGFCGMTIKGVTYDEKKTAGERLVLACSELPNAEEKVIGSYRGFELSLRFDTFRSEYQAILKGQRRYPVPLGTDPLGNIIRLDNSLNNFPERINSAENELATLHQQQAAAQIEVEKPFPQEEELTEKSARLAELNAQLDVDEKSHEPEQDEEEQENVSRRPSVLAALEEKSDKPEPVKPFRSYYDKDGDAR